MSKPDGGPAFPREDYQGDNAPGQSGMSLRDYFAAAAMSGLLSWTPEGDSKIQDCAWDAYRYADAMLAEREK